MILISSKQSQDTTVKHLFFKSGGFPKTHKYRLSTVTDIDSLEFSAKETLTEGANIYHIHPKL